MTASELRELAKKLNNHAIGYGGYAIEGQLREAAEVLELVAWAEEWPVEISRDGSIWSVSWDGGPEICRRTLIDTLRRAREASKA